MGTDASFQTFHSEITLREDQAKRIQNEHLALRKAIEADPEIKWRLSDVFLQGSYAHDTAVRPQVDGEYDVDVVLGLNLTPSGQTTTGQPVAPKEALSWLGSRLGMMSAYRNRVRANGRCVTIEYKGDFHMDVVPAHAPRGCEDMISVPDKDVSRWIDSNPKGFLTWSRGCNRETSGQFARIVKYLKWWRNARFSEAVRPKSIVLQVIAGGALPRTMPSDGHALAASLSTLEQQTRGGGTIVVPNPSLAGENLAQKWEASHVRIFHTEVSRAAAAARLAAQSSSASTSKLLWRQLLGDRFPV